MLEKIIRGSIFCRVLRFLFESLKSSRFMRILNAVVCFFAASFDESRIRRVLIGRAPMEERTGRDSVVYRVLGGIVGAVNGLFIKLFTAIGKGWDSSLFAKLFGWVFGKSYAGCYVGLAAFFATFIFLVPHEYWANPLGLFVAAFLYMLYVIRLAVREPDDTTRPGTHFDAMWLPVLVFGFTLLVGTFTSYDRGDSVRVLTFFITSLALCFVLYASIRDEKGLQTVGGFMYGVLFVMSLVALAQRVLGVEADAALTDMDLNAGMPGRVFSTLANPNNYAEFLVLFLPYAVAFVLALPKGSKWKKLLALGLIAPLLSLLFTYSRSGWIAFAIALIIFVALYDKKYLPYLIILVLVAIPLLPDNIRNRILTIGNMKDTSSSYRVDIWTGCLDMLKDYWFTGIGLGTGGFAKIYPPYAIGISGVAPHSHMHFMEMLIELGALGFVGYICMTFTLIRRSFVAASRRVRGTVRLFAIASAASMTGIIMIGCFEYCWFYPRVMFAFFVCAGVTMAAARLARSDLGHE